MQLNEGDELADQTAKRPPSERAAGLRERLFGSDLSVEEAAFVLDIDPQTVRRYLREGVVSGYQVGRGRGEWRIPERALVRYAAELQAHEDAVGVLERTIDGFLEGWLYSIWSKQAGATNGLFMPHLVAYLAEASPSRSVIYVPEEDEAADAPRAIRASLAGNSARIVEFSGAMTEQEPVPWTGVAIVENVAIVQMHEMTEDALATLYGYVVFEMPKRLSVESSYPILPPRAIVISNLHAFARDPADHLVHPLGPGYNRAAGALDVLTAYGRERGTVVIVRSQPSTDEAASALWEASLERFILLSAGKDRMRLIAQPIGVPGYADILDLRYDDDAGRFFAVDSWNSAKGSRVNMVYEEYRRRGMKEEDEQDEPADQKQEAPVDDVS